ncbi:hypothetical protein [Pedococcus bigeumensis]|uniref:hypothetical protein n=1 Tax=Pedococcus bigeumensis TaxID=433644 RepID=UPI00112B1646|nr:hypothetical protein [Pedococcus bigeumensis]
MSDAEDSGRVLRSRRPEDESTSVQIGLDRDRQVDILSRSTGVVVVGIANAWLADVVEGALAAKRQAEQNQRAFWEHLQVVFLAEHLLEHVQDQHGWESPNADEVVEQRVRQASHIKRRLMSFLIRHGTIGQWALYSSPHLLPFVGSIFEIPDEGKLVQLMIPSGPSGDASARILEIRGDQGQIFQSTFQQIVQASREEHEVIVVGSPTVNGDFVCRGARFRRALLREGSNASDWIPAMVAVTWRRGAQGAEPLLQVNTPQNSTREMGKASHVSGYINVVDQALFEGIESATPLQEESPSLLLRGAVRSAIKRELRSDFGIVETPTIEEYIDTIPFYYADKENLFFYLMSQEISRDQVFPPSCQMFAWKLPELESARRRQVALNALAALRAALRPAERRRIGEVLALNFRVHGLPELAFTVLEALDSGVPSDGIVTRLEELAEANLIYKHAGGRVFGVDGLAGLQYRIFHSHLLPTYARLGVQGAVAAMQSIEDQYDRKMAATSLAGLYSDEDFVCSLPMEV